MRGVTFFVFLLVVVTLFSFVSVSAVDWYQQVSGTTDSLNAVWLANEQTAWAVGGTPLPTSTVILFSDDGGISWTPQTSPVARQLNGVCFADENHGWAVGYDVILHTNNGGETWVEQAIPISSTFQEIFCIDANTAYVVGNAGHILKTTTGGAVWFTVSSGVSVDLAGSSFIDATHGYVVGDTGTILKMDGGAFERLDSGISYSLNDIDCLSMDDCWIVAMGNNAYHTTNGGESWDHSVAGDYVASLTSLDTLDSDHVWVTGQGILRSTDDGGASWAAADSDVTTIGLIPVAFMRGVMFRGSVGLAVGDSGMILRKGEVTLCPEIENTCIENNQPYVTVRNEVTGCVTEYGCVLLPQENHTLQIPRTCLDDYRDCLEEHWPQIDECDAWEFCEGTDEVLANYEKEQGVGTFAYAAEFDYFFNFFENEEVNVYVTQNDGSVKSFGLLLKDKKVSAIDAYASPTMKISLSQKTIDSVKSSENPKKTALEAIDNGDITVSGVGFKAIKMFFFKAGLKMSLPFVK